MAPCFRDYVYSINTVYDTCTHKYTYNDDIFLALFIDIYRCMFFCFLNRFFKIDFYLQHF